MHPRHLDLALEEREIRATLGSVWASLSQSLRGPTQFLGRHYAGCAATIGVMPKCDFSCTGCYLNAAANRARPRSLSDLKEQLEQIRAWLGPCGNVQLTDGEVSLRPEAELIEIIAFARGLGLVPMLMTHGETFRHRAGFLERLMEFGGLTEVSIHIDTTQRGRRDQYAQARKEADLHGLRAEFANLIRTARRRTGRRLEAASTMTVTRQNLEGVAGTVRWFLANADAFKMLSFQPLASVGRTDPMLQGVDPDRLWERIGEGAGDPAIRRGEGWLGHPACSRFVQGLAVRRGQGEAFVPLYRRDQPREMKRLDGLLKRLGGTSFRLDSTAKAWRRAVRIFIRHGGFLSRQVLPQVLELIWRAGSWRANYFCLVSHHFMSAAEIATPSGQERLAACAFKVPLHGRLESMCTVNALGLREDYYAAHLATRAAP